MDTTERKRKDLIRYCDQKYQKKIRKELDKVYPVSQIDPSPKLNKNYADSMLEFLSTERIREIEEIKKDTSGYIHMLHKIYCKK